jgi:hypothetical protein
MLKLNQGSFFKAMVAQGCEKTRIAYSLAFSASKWLIVEIRDRCKSQAKRP